MDVYDDEVAMRMATEEEEAGAEVLAAELAEPALVLVTRNISSLPIPVGALIHSYSRIGNVLLRGIPGEYDVVGGLALPTSTVSLKGCAESGAMAGSLIHRRQTGSGGPATMFVPCHHSVPPEASVVYVKSLLSVVAPQLVICLTDIPEEALIQCSCDSSNVDFYQLPNSLAAKISVGAGEVPHLPPGCMMTGCSAALMCAAEARGIPAVACCHVQHQAFAPLAKSELVKISNLVDSILRSDPKSTAATQQLQLQQAVASAEADFKLKDAPRVYL